MFRVRVLGFRAYITYIAFRVEGLGFRSKVQGVFENYLEGQGD